jgi:hypothetical protein
MALSVNIWRSEWQCLSPGLLCVQPSNEDELGLPRQEAFLASCMIVARRLVAEKVPQRLLMSAQCYAQLQLEQKPGLQEQVGCASCSVQIKQGKATTCLTCPFLLLQEQQLPSGRPWVVSDGDHLILDEGALNRDFRAAQLAAGASMDGLLRGLRRALRREGEDRAKVKRSRPL